MCAEVQARCRADGKGVDWLGKEGRDGEVKGGGRRVSFHELPPGVLPPCGFLPSAIRELKKGTSHLTRHLLRSLSIELDLCRKRGSSKLSLKEEGGEETHI